ncbi:MAG: hypothetical protein BWY09_00830 [Candidatus Hydrogenedentes bacterium ADurb.Bin179]|nr:MAG: hypothetical protein BWY09_00830 [Candidatus Hydrogenedentes bacterium ADurb.Bin179]
MVTFHNAPPYIGPMSVNYKTDRLSKSAYFDRLKGGCPILRTAELFYRFQGQSMVERAESFYELYVAFGN